MKIQLERNPFTVRITDNENGVIITLTRPDESRVAEIAYSAHSADIIGVWDYTERVHTYKCYECDATYSDRNAPQFCEQCGAEEVMLIEEEGNDDA